MADSPDNPVGGRQEHFLTTHWSVVLKAGQTTDGDGAEALESLCRAYWYPLYAHVRRQGFDPHEAQDMTQEFFARMLEKKYLRQVDREKGRFRSFLLASLKHFLCNERDRKNALKRGGGRTVVSFDEEGAEERFKHEGAQDLPPDEQFERAWALAIMEQAMMRLLVEQRDAGKADLFEALKPYLSAKPDHGEYERLASRLKLTANAIGVTVKRLRGRYRELIQSEVANTVSDPSAVADEMNHVFMALTR